MTVSPTEINALSRWVCSPELLPQSCIRRMNMKSASSRSAKPLSESCKSTSMQSKTDWGRLKADDAAVNPNQPEAAVKHIVRGIVRRGLAPLPSKISIHCAWIKTCWSGSKRKASAIRLESTPCRGRFVMHRFNWSAHADMQPKAAASRHGLRPGGLQR